MTRTTLPTGGGPGADRTFFDSWQDENSASRPARPQREPRLPRTRAWLRTRRRAGALAATAAVVAAGASLLHAGSASADPSANTWYRLRMCESGNNYSINTGNDHYGAYQFDLATWRGVGGHGYPNLASPAEQDARALILYRLRGWEPWQCAGILGLRGDKDAGSGVTNDIHVPGTGSGGGTGGSTGFPSGGYTEGANNGVIARFQKQMGRRGAPLVGTGQFGPKTLTVIETLQRLNGHAVTGRLDQATYDLAFHGRYGSDAAAPQHPRVPAFPCGVTYGYGDHNAVIARFQKQMGTRGAPLEGTGQFGPKTTAVVKRLQRLNGFRPNGHLGPRTWRAAWLGNY